MDRGDGRTSILALGGPFGAGKSLTFVKCPCGVPGVDCVHEFHHFQRRELSILPFSRERPRRHVHGPCPDGEAKFWLEPVLAAAQSHGLSEQQLRSAKSSIEAHAGEIRSAWQKHFGAEALNVSPHGFWLLMAAEELFVPFDQFPWFRNATLAQISKVDRPSPNHLYWPDLDVDPTVESIRHPQQVPLVSGAGT